MRPRRLTLGVVTAEFVLGAGLLAAFAFLGHGRDPLHARERFALPNSAKALQAQSSGGDIEAGRRVFEAHCAMCHGRDATGMMGMHPSLWGAVERLTPEGVEVAIRKGRQTMPPMPAWEGRLSDTEIADVVAYITSLPSGPRNFGPDAGGGDGMGGMMGGRTDRDSGGDSPAVAVAVAAVALVLGAGAVILFAVRRHRRDMPGVENARAVLDRRYAAGELTREEYLERRRDLET